MARTAVPLTNTQIKQAKAKLSEYSLADGDGLSLRVRPNGSKSWFFNYVVPISKKRFKISFGQYPEVSLADARRKRSEARALVAAGIDPKVHSQQMRKEAELEYSQTLQVVAKRWFKRWKQRKRIDELTASKAWRLLELHVFPKLGSLPMSDISAPIVIDALSPLEKSNHLETLQKTRTKLNQIATYAVNTGVIHSNPLSGLAEAFKANHGTHNPSIDIQELPSLIRNVMQSSSTFIIKSAFMWQLMTCVRPAEAAGARWEEIDLERHQWLIPANRMKGGLNEHIVPLTPEMLALLDRMKPISGHYEHVFTGHRDPRKSVSSQSVNKLLKDCGYNGVLTSHGLRAIFSTTANEQKLDSELVERCLAHREKNKSKAAYDHSTMVESRRPIMEWWTKLIDEADKTGQIRFAKVDAD